MDTNRNPVGRVLYSPWTAAIVVYALFATWAFLLN
jgi:hypothetical protein